MWGDFKQSNHYLNPLFKLRIQFPSGFFERLLRIGHNISVICNGNIKLKILGLNVNVVWNNLVAFSKTRLPRLPSQEAWLFVVVHFFSNILFVRLLDQQADFPIKVVIL